MADRNTSIRASQLRNGTVTDKDIQDDSLTGAKFVDVTISGGKIADGVISESKLDIVNSPVDGYYLKYTIASGMEWFAGGGGVSDHGALTGLIDDDHTQYLLASGTRSLTGNWNIGNFKLGINTVPSYPLDIAYSPGAAASRTLSINTTPFGTATGIGQSHYGFSNRVQSSFDQSTYSCNLYGAYFSTNASGFYQNVHGIYNYTNYSGATSITSIQSFVNFAYNNSAGTLGTLYGIWGLACHSSTGTTNSAYGNYSTVQCNNASGTLGVGYGYYSYLNHQSGTANTGYLFRGNYFGTWGTKWGIRLTGETKNYLSGYLGIGDSTNTEKLNVAGNLMLSGNAFSYIKGDTVDVNGDSALALIGAATRLHYVGSAGVGAYSQGRFMAYYGGFATSTVIQMFHTGVTGIIQSNSGNLELIAATAGSMLLKTTNTVRVHILSGGNVGIGNITATALLDINSDILRLRTAKTPATAGAAGNAGDICWDASYIYVCTATNTWKRTAISTW